MPWIQNVSMAAVKAGNHADAGHNSMLIQICDPAYEFPTPAAQFREVHQFEFLDIEPNSPDFDKFDEFAITDTQAEQLVWLLQHARSHNMNVVVHCHAGICRSGAVCEVGVMMGLQDTKVPRQPNLMVKHKMMRALGWTYDNEVLH